ncbi:CDP-alcohol phosphatidyltransferase family protein [Microbacterium sp. UFMG61]|uniref:CDP-alcohol phosphatidyltransferase family protein n=1 Tax=Microbacterium sp. UFMG61 TaxID=2745935 RepID=UPI001E41320D|nr:CDP-alcohol phosphatidyltransferase family protein [Microbacterium sp. UFMG61]
MRRLASAQKGRAKGAPAYSVYVNRPVGRVFAAAAHTIGLSPNGVTAVSAAFTFSGILVLALVDPSWWTGIVVWLLLAIGYALDSADGQVARLRGGGSLAGEWLDHFIDAIKIVSLPIATAIGLYRFSDLPMPYVLVPLAFAIVATATFFGMILNDLLKSSKGIASSAETGGGGALRSIILLPVDYGIVCLVYVLWGWATVFALAYAFFFAAAAAFCLLAAVRWFRAMRSLGTGGANA